MKKMDQVYRASELICNTYAEQIQGASEPVKVWIIHKVKHTFQVAHEIMNILYHEQKIYDSFDEADKKLTETAAVLHDLGRLYQHNKGKEILSSDVFEHGAAAVGLLKDNPEFNNPILLFAIAEHNHYIINYNNPYYAVLDPKAKKKAEIIAKLLRDADKLDNIRHLMYSDFHPFDDRRPKTGLSEGVKEALRHHASVPMSEVVSNIDRITAYLGWINDIYFEYTKQTIKELGFIRHFLSKAEQVGTDSEDIAFLKKYLEV